MFRAATLSKRSFTEEAEKCLLRELINAGHSIRMCLTEYNALMQIIILDR